MTFNLGDLTKPATVLIEKISDAVGGIYRPHQIRRIAEAEAQADKIKAVSGIEITELQRRAMQRFFSEEAKKQQNIESITAKALPELAAAADPQKMEDDWITNFFEKCRLISDDEMQTLWAKVLAGEANAPGRYSKRTISVLASLDKSDAELFMTLISFCWLLGNVTAMIYGSAGSDFDVIYGDAGITFASLQRLDEIGLISFDMLAGFRRMKLPEKVVAMYYGKPVEITFRKPGDNELLLGTVLLSKTGQEFAPVCGAVPRPGFREYVIARWTSMGLQVKDLAASTSPSV